MRKAQGLPISTVILAALGLVILVVLFAITTGRLGIFSAELQKCHSPCISEGDCQAKGGFFLPGAWLDQQSGLLCAGKLSPDEQTKSAPGGRIAPGGCCSSR